ncbi:GNAT family N-acetyltransferase [Qipengyuania sediminis]|uniref:GNAT family N-acetyltransferase n=1 Tax=Qipengyuania sediminis TaxID=1532023 RepID=UPI001F115C16|nr:GNAT family N-acetyltransferase [Qipengyuania sediminis]
MDRQPRLEGETVLLRPLAVADREALYAVASDPALWALHPMHDRWQRPVFDAMFDDALAHHGALAILERATARIIGSSQYRPSAKVPDAIEIGWTFLARNHWGGTTNREVKRLMLTHLFRHAGSAVFRIGADNLRSRRAMEKIGGQIMPLTENIAYPDGRTFAHVFYAIDRAGFADGPLSAS